MIPLTMGAYEVKLTVGRQRKPGTLVVANDRIFFKFGFWKPLNEEIKKMEGRKYHGFEKPPRKIWSAPITEHNLFQLERMLGGNPYALYDAPLKPFTPIFPLRQHQIDMTAHILTRKCCIVAGEMGTGKTLTLIEAAHHIGPLNSESFWYVAPKSALVSVRAEFNKWKSKIVPRFITFQGLVKIMKDWKGQKAPRLVVFDESARLKNPSSQRSEAARELARGVRQDWGDEAYVVELCGAPAPKSPADWWHQCFVARPGFLIEGNIHLFKERLAVIVEKESIQGGKFPHIATWKDATNKCNLCGELKGHDNHEAAMCTDPSKFHDFVACKNEVEILHQRMKGLVIVKLKKECLDLPEKQYRELIYKPTPSILRAAGLIAKTARNAALALERLRELSDGFQYRMHKTGETEECEVCLGSGKYKEWLNAEGNPVQAGEISAEERVTDCSNCEGSGRQDKVARETVIIDTPKDEGLIDLLDEHEDIGRLVVFGGFTGTVHRITKKALHEGWRVIQVSESKWTMHGGDGEIIKEQPEELVRIFQEDFKNHPKLCWSAHPASSGTGLTLTASPSSYYFSNTFNADDRIQSEDRIHRMGMDINRGATIIDAFHLPSDRHVFDNIKKKRGLQAITLGEIKALYEGT